MKIYGVINESEENIVFSSKYTPIDNEILMSGRRPSAEHVATAQGEWVLPQKTFEEVKEEKYKEIIDGANTAKEFLSLRFSHLESETWPEQEAGARKVLNDESNTKNNSSLLILNTPQALESAIELISTLAMADNVAVEEFSKRICCNADIAHALGIQAFLEQRSFESALNKASTIEEIQNLAVRYTVLKEKDNIL